MTLKTVLWATGLFILLLVHALGLSLAASSMDVSGPFNFNPQYPIGYALLVMSSLILLGLPAKRWRSVVAVYLALAFILVSVNFIKHPPLELTGGGKEPEVWPAPITSYWINYGSLLVLTVKAFGQPLAKLLKRRVT